MSGSKLIIRTLRAVVMLTTLFTVRSAMSGMTSASDAASGRFADWVVVGAGAPGLGAEVAVLRVASAAIAKVVSPVAYVSVRVRVMSRLLITGG